MKMPDKKLLIVTLGIAVVGVSLFGTYAMWWGLNINIQVQNVGSILATLLLTATFIERAVEVVITPWRDPGWDKLNAKATDPAASAADRKTATDELTAYVGTTKRYAFTAALMFSLVAAMVGVRALWPFLSADQHAMDTFIKYASLGQKNTFIVFDVILSAALMAGGANGIHSAINMFTSFFDANAQKSQDSVKA